MFCVFLLVVFFDFLCLLSPGCARQASLRRRPHWRRRPRRRIQPGRGAAAPADPTARPRAPLGPELRGCVGDNLLDDCLDVFKNKTTNQQQNKTTKQTNNTHQQNNKQTTKQNNKTNKQHASHRASTNEVTSASEDRQTREALPRAVTDGPATQRAHGHRGAVERPCMFALEPRQSARRLIQTYLKYNTIYKIHMKTRCVLMCSCFWDFVSYCVEFQGPTYLKSRSVSYSPGVWECLGLC
jgi:hypothetical protein